MRRCCCNRLSGIAPSIFSYARQRLCDASFLSFGASAGLFSMSFPMWCLFGLFLLIWQTTMGPLADAIPMKFSRSPYCVRLRKEFGTTILRFSMIACAQSPILGFIVVAAGLGPVCCFGLCGGVSVQLRK